MQRKELESAAKLSGSYYTPDKIADFLSNWGLGLDKETISKIETPMIYLGEWEQDGSVFADLRNSKKEPIRIFHERLEDYV